MSTKADFDGDLNPAIDELANYLAESHYADRDGEFLLASSNRLDMFSHPGNIEPTGVGPESSNGSAQGRRKRFEAHASVTTNHGHRFNWLGPPENGNTAGTRLHPPPSPKTLDNEMRKPLLSNVRPPCQLFIRNP